MDYYEVFLVSRMHEERLKTHDNAKAVNRGQAITGRTTTALAIILIVRTVLVPAIMHTLGSANWRLPEWLNRRMPHLDIEGEVIQPAAPKTETETEVPVAV